MWFFKKNKMTTEFNAYEESQKRMKLFEEKYKISSFDLYNHNYDSITFEGSDKYLWETYIRDYVRCGGFLMPTTISEDVLPNPTFNEDIHVKKPNSELKKEVANTTTSFFMQKM